MNHFLGGGGVEILVINFGYIYQISQARNCQIWPESTSVEKFFDNKMQKQISFTNIFIGLLV